MLRRVLGIGALLLLACLSSARETAGTRDPGLERGIRRVEAGEWNQGLAELNAWLRGAAKDKARKAEVAEAFLYSGLAYVGLGETSSAISQFAEALARNPQLQIPAAHSSQAALDAFAVARREAAAPVVKAHKKSALPFVLGGAAVAGLGAAVATRGGPDTSTPGVSPAGIPLSFSVSGVTGSPQLVLLSAVPSSAATISLLRGAPLLTFSFNNDASLPGHVQIVTELVGPQGSCMAGHSEVVAVDRAAATTTLLVNAWQVTCPGAFTTTSMNARILDADANIAVSLTTYAGGYLFTRS